MFERMAFILVLLMGTSGCTVKTSDGLYSDGIQLLREGKTDSAIVLFKNALEIDQHNLNARYELARAYLSEEQYELAEKEFHKVKLLNPYQPDIKKNLEKLKNRRGKPEQATRNAVEDLLGKVYSTDAPEVMSKTHPEAGVLFLQSLLTDPEKLTTKFERIALHEGQGESGKARVLPEER